MVPPPQPQPAPPGQKKFAQGAAKPFETFPKFTQIDGKAPTKLPLPEPEKDAGVPPRPLCGCWSYLSAAQARACRPALVHTAGQCR